MKIILPGMEKQIELVLNNIDVVDNSVLVIGSGSEAIAKRLANLSQKKCELIVEDYDSLMNSKLMLENEKIVSVKLMDFEITDFSKEQFDLVFAQASISSGRRNKIIKDLIQ